MAKNKSNKKVANGLVAMSSAAVLAVYAAGYVRTRPAADRLNAQVYERPLAPEVPTRKASAEVTPPPPAPSRPTPAASPAVFTADAEPKHAPITVNTAAAVRPHEQAVVSAPKSAVSKTESSTQTGVSVNTAATTAGANATTAAPALQSSTSASPVTATIPNGEGSVATASAATSASSAAPAASSTPAAPAQPVWKDGKYTAWGTCRHGDIQATVVIQGGRILSADITDCQTRYSCDIIDSLPPKVISRQKNKFDAIGGATESAYAYYGAVYWALDQASK